MFEVHYKDSEAELDRVKKLRKLCEEFAMLAAGIGKVIIAERNSPNKTIPPITSKVGGIGTEKYFQFFSFF